MPNDYRFMGKEGIMKATMEFDLPEEQDDFNYAVNGINYYTNLSDIRAYLRRKRKYGLDPFDTIDSVIDHIWTLISKDVD